MNLPEKLEAVLFSQGDPTGIGELARGLNVADQEVASALLALDRSYGERGAGIRVLRSPEGVQLVTAPDAAESVAAFVTASMRDKLTPAAAETLAIIAYRGPISRAGIEAIRGVNSSFTLRLLALRGLVMRAPHPADRRSFVYEVSADFLKHLGVTKVADLPEYQELRRHAGMTKLAEDAETGAPEALDQASQGSVGAAPPS